LTDFRAEGDYKKGSATVFTCKTGRKRPVFRKARIGTEVALVKSQFLRYFGHSGVTPI
jgi:hypothetical protein